MVLSTVNIQLYQNYKNTKSRALKIWVIIIIKDHEKVYVLKKGSFYS